MLHEFPNGLILRILGNKDILGKSQIWMKTLGDQSPFQKLNFGNSSQKTRKSRYQTFIFLATSTGFLYFVPNTLPKIVDATEYLKSGTEDIRRTVGKNTKWYKERWNKGTVTGSDECKLCWGFEYHLRKTTTARRPDVTINYKNKNKIFFIDMACPSENNGDAKHAEKLQKYQQLARDDQGTML